MKSNILLRMSKSGPSKDITSILVAETVSQNSIVSTCRVSPSGGSTTCKIGSKNGSRNDTALRMDSPIQASIEVLVKILATKSCLDLLRLGMYYLPKSSHDPLALASRLE
jgi:hypothetical protein